MSQLLSRIILAIIMIPAAAMVYFISFVQIEERVRRRSYYYRDEYFSWLYSGLVVWLFIAIWWLLLWRKTIRWTSARKRLTLWSALAATIVGAVAAAAMRLVNEQMGYFTFTCVSPLVWLSLTVLAWRETASERAERIASSGKQTLVCPTCGYNLTGLTQARCPECGSSFTLDDLYASQPSRAAAEIEQD